MKGRNGNGFGLTLGMAVQLLPTPTAGDSRNAANKTSGRTNPDSQHHSGTTLVDAMRLLRSAPGSADSTSPSTPRSEPSPPGCANPTPTVEPFSSATGPESTCCPTCGKSTPGSTPWTCCTPGIRVSRSRRQDDDSARTTRGTFGPPSGTPFAFYDPEQSCWRTSQGTFDWDSTPCSPTLPTWGSLHGGALYEQPTWEPPTDGHGSSSLPTPTRRDHKGRNQRDDTTCLPGAVALLPTLGANDVTGGEGQTREARQEKGTGGPALRDIGHLLPTHRVAATRSSRKSMVENRQWSAPSLAQALEISQGILPREFKSWDEVPGWAGASTSPPSDAGDTSSDDQHPGQLTIEDA